MVRRKIVSRLCKTNNKSPRIDHNGNEVYPRTSTPANENIPLNFNGSNASSIRGTAGMSNYYLDRTQSTAIPDLPSQSDSSSTDTIYVNFSGANSSQTETSSRTDADSILESNSSQATTDSPIRLNRSGRIRNEETALETSRSTTDYNILRRTRSGRIEKRETVAEREIRQLRATTHSLIKVAPFTRIVKEIMEKVTGGRRLRISSEAIEALMETAEASLITLFEASDSATSHAGRTTLRVEDIQHVRKILSLFGVRF